MDELNHFARVFKCVVIATLAPVIFTTFVTIPVALERHPGEHAGETTAQAGQMAGPSRG
ncbi:MAG: hypothetical protein RLZZ494_206 [Pseudomonadota bacterium]|jgi:hypothetical protein